MTIGRKKVLLVVSLDTVQMRAIDTPKVPPHGQRLDAPIAVEDFDLHALRYRLEPPATAGQISDSPSGKTDDAYEEPVTFARLF